MWYKYVCILAYNLYVRARALHFVPTIHTLCTQGVLPYTIGTCRNEKLTLRKTSSSTPIQYYLLKSHRRYIVTYLCNDRLRLYFIFSFFFFLRQQCLQMLFYSSIVHEYRSGIMDLKQFLVVKWYLPYSLFVQFFLSFIRTYILRTYTSIYSTSLS